LKINKISFQRIECCTSSYVVLNAIFVHLSSTNNRLINAEYTVIALDWSTRYWTVIPYVYNTNITEDNP
jgi:hypothetical protein